MRTFLLNILLALAWAAISPEFGPEAFLFGYLIAFFILWLGHRAGLRSAYFTKVYRISKFTLFFGWELLKANFRVIYEVITPRNGLKPGIIAIDLEAESAGNITLLSNLITLTPDSMALEVSEDCKTLYVHAMYIRDADRFRRGIKEGLEAPILEIFR